MLCPYAVVVVAASLLSNAHRQALAAPRGLIEELPEPAAIASDDISGIPLQATLPFVSSTAALEAAAQVSLDVASRKVPPPASGALLSSCPS